MVADAQRSNVEDQISPAGPRLLRIEDIAHRCAISRSMAWKLVSQGDLRSIRIGRAVRVRPADLEAYLAGAVRDA